MPRYRIPVKSYINNRIIQPGEIIEFNGKPGRSWECMDQEVSSDSSMDPKPVKRGRPPVVRGVPN